MKKKLLVANVSDIDARGSRKLKVGELDIALFRMTDGSILAVENKCPHKGGQLSEGMVCGTAVHCPLHDWKIDLLSGHAHEPDEGCVATFQTEIDEHNGAIYVTI